jgi:tRNA(Ile2) C34 agmatinyltransferase TiaS
MGRTLFTLAMTVYWLLGTTLAVGAIGWGPPRERTVTVPLALTMWGACTAIAVIAIVHPHRLHRNRERARLNLCPACGYDLRATPERCPECGAQANQRTTIHEGVV